MYAGICGSLCEFNRLASVIGACPCDHLHLVADRVNCGLEQGDLLDLGKGRGLAGGATHNDAVGAVIAKEPGQSPEGSVVDGSVIAEWCDDSGQDLAKWCFGSALHGHDGSRRPPGNLASMTTPSDFVKDVDAASFPQEVLQRSREVPVVVDFWAEWCQPCRILGPILEKVTAESGGAVELVKVDVDANQELAAQYGVQGIPMVVAFRDGAIADTFTGALPEAAVREWIEGVLPTELDLMVDQARTAQLSDDGVTAEHILRQVLDQKSDHSEAGTSLASLLIDRGETEEALIVLGRLVPDAEVDRLQSAARLKASSGHDLADLEDRLAVDPDNEELRIELAKALAARAEFEPALDRLLSVVRDKGPLKDEARTAMLDIFEVLGDDHPLTLTYRRQLASALF